MWGLGCLRGRRADGGVGFVATLGAAAAGPASRRQGSAALGKSAGAAAVGVQAASGAAFLGILYGASGFSVATPPGRGGPSSVVGCTGASGGGGDGCGAFLRLRFSVDASDAESDADLARFSLAPPPPAALTRLLDDADAVTDRWRAFFSAPAPPRSASRASSSDDETLQAGRPSDSVSSALYLRRPSEIKLGKTQRDLVQPNSS